MGCLDSGVGRRVIRLDRRVGLLGLPRDDKDAADLFRPMLEMMSKSTPQDEQDRLISEFNALSKKDGAYAKIDIFKDNYDTALPMTLAQAVQPKLKETANTNTTRVPAKPYAAQRNMVAN